MAEGSDSDPSGSGPDPPDIRPSGRHQQHQHYLTTRQTSPSPGSDRHRRQHHVSVNGYKHQLLSTSTSDSRSKTHARSFNTITGTRRSGRGSSASLWLFVLAFLAFTGLSVNAQHVPSYDPYTSGQSSLFGVETGQGIGAGAGAGAAGGFNTSKPILSSLAWLFGQLNRLLVHTTGYDLPSRFSTIWGDLIGLVLGGQSDVDAAGASGPSSLLGKRTKPETIVEAIMIPVLVALSGIFAGLTLGYFSVDQTQLQVLSISGTPQQQELARRIIPVRKDSHLLLTTLILCNMIVNEALPEVANGPLGGGVQAVIVSTALVVIFAEIIPQSVCSRYGLLIGARAAKPVRVLIWIFSPLAWPIAKLLEWILGAHHGIIYRRSELRELIKFHAAGGEGGGDLDYDTVTMAQGALDLAGKSVREAMTPIDKVFMLPIEAKLDYETLGMVVRSGHSRVPVYQMVEVPDVNLSAATLVTAKNKMVKKVIGSLLVKSCVLLDPEDATPLASIPINAIPSVPCDEPLTNMLNVFQEGRSHMAIVSRRPRRREDDPEDAESVITAAAGGLRQRFMRKVATITHGDKSSSSGSEDSSADENDAEKGEAAKVKRKKSRKKHAKPDKESTEGSSSTADPGSPDKVKKKRGKQGKEQSGDGMPRVPTEAEEVKARAEAEKKKKAFAYSAGLTQLEQTVPADAQLPPYMVEKFFEGLEGAPLGIITLEDVLEELIGEEIYDEYDEHGGTRNPASAFIPREAAMAARQAAMEREKALAAAVPLPTTNDADIERPVPSSNPSRRYVPKLPLPRFTRGRRPLSQPGKSRSADDKGSTPAAASGQGSNAAPTPTTETPSAPGGPAAVVRNPTVDAGTEGTTTAANTNTESQSPSQFKQDTTAQEVKLDGADIPRTVSPTELGDDEYVKVRSKSERGTTRREVAFSQSAPAPSSGRKASLPSTSETAQRGASVSPGGGKATPVVSADVRPTAVPARLLPGGGAATPSAAPPSGANLLSEALLLERGRRRLAAQQGTVPSMVRLPSTAGTSRSAVPSRQPTPPSAVSAAGSGSAPVGPQGASGAAVPGPQVASAATGSDGPPGTGGVLSPVPLPLPVRKGTKFKSVPTPIGTPRLGSGAGGDDNINPLEPQQHPQKKERDTSN